jgi:hypothetical protein
MIARSRLIEVEDQLFFDGSPYSGAAFSVDEENSFSAVIVDAGTVTNIYRPLAAPAGMNCPQLDITEGLLNEMDDNYIFPHETLLPLSEISFKGIGYYIDSNNSGSYPAVAEFYFENRLSSETVHWFDNGNMANIRIKTSNYKGSFFWHQAGILESLCIIPVNGIWSSPIIDAKFELNCDIKSLYFDKNHLNKIEEISNDFLYFPKKLLETIDMY